MADSIEPIEGETADAGESIDTIARRMRAPLSGAISSDLGPAEHALLAEASELTGTSDPRELIRIALTELIERRRFQNWVDAHDPLARTGRA